MDAFIHVGAYVYYVVLQFGALVLKGPNIHMKVNLHWKTLKNLMVLELFCAVQ